MSFDPAAFLDDFRAEAADRVRDLDAQLLTLERDPSDLRPIREMFVAAHTVKGGAAMQLSDAGFQVDALADGAEALVRILEGSYALVIASVETRGLRGLDLATALRGSQTRRHVPIILMSSAEHPADRQRAADLGID